MWNYLNNLRNVITLSCYLLHTCSAFIINKVSIVYFITFNFILGIFNVFLMYIFLMYIFNVYLYRRIFTLFCCYNGFYSTSLGAWFLTIH